MKKPIRKILKNLLFSRSGQYRPEPELEKDWNKIWIESSHKRICTLSKIDPSSAAPFVILAHPYVAEAKLFFIKNGHANMYLRQNINVIIPDFNGFGESPFVNFRFEEDLSLVTQYLARHYPNRHIIVHGISFGASQTINFAGLSPMPVQRIIVENCLDSNLSYYKKRNKYIYILTRLLMALYPSGNKNHNYIRSIARLHPHQKVLFIYNSEDDLTTIEMGQQLKNACSVPNEMIVFPGAHLKAYKESPDRYSDSIRTFIWDEHHSSRNQNGF